MDHLHEATYCIEDDKLRINPGCRLPRDEYDELRKIGFAWAPKQKIFIAVWSPKREDICRRMCGEIEEEGISPEERAELRAQRFSGYSESALSRGENAEKAIENLTGGIPTGQPILIGHHSERRARRDADKIERGIEKAVTEYNKANYWEFRAAQVKRHQSYLERPEVIFRRIKKLEADIRKYERSKTPDECERGLLEFRYYRDNHIDKPTEDQKKDCEDYINGLINARTEYYGRWIEHIDGRIAYEKAMLDDKGGIDVNEEQKPLEIGGAIRVGNEWHKIERVNKGAGGLVVSVSYHDPRAAWRKRWTKSIEKIHEYLTRQEYESIGSPLLVDLDMIDPKSVYMKTPGVADEKLEGLKGTTVEAVGGVDDLFPTPDHLVDRMIELADIKISMSILEPSAGTGNILKKLENIKLTLIGFGEPVLIHWYELDSRLNDNLNRLYAGCQGSDFLESNPGPCYDRVIMNPPFSHEQDIDHVRHAFKFLKETGILVAIVSEHCFFAGSNKAKEFREFLSTCMIHHEEVSPLAWKSSGTSVNTRIIVLEKC